MNKTVRERYKQLRRVVVAAPEDHLHMKEFEQQVPECGTAYCAAGRAAHDKWFNEQGFIWEVYGKGGMPIISGGKFEGTYGRDAVYYFFEGVPTNDIDRLFAIGSCALDDDVRVPKKAVLANIDRILSGEPTLPYQV